MTLETRVENGAWKESMDAGVAAFERKRYAKAEEFFGAAIKECDKFDKDDPRLAKTYNNFAALCHTQGKYSMAEEYYRRALAIHERIYGEEHAEVSTNLHNLAVLFSAKQNFAEAEPLYRRALEIREKVAGSNHADLAPILRNLARLMRKTGRDGDAADLERRADEVSGQRITDNV